uniref:Vinculin n=1 Tax=Plectus sambesii TaxID=2011161 RepID=A0A914VK06_9BILA
YTVAGRLEQALRWLDNPGVDDKGLGLQAIKAVTEEGRRLANQLHGADRQKMLNL